MASELRAQIHQDVGILVPVAEFLDAPSVAGLAEWLASALAETNAPRPDGVTPTTADRAAEASDLADARWIDLLTQVAEVSDDDVDTLLREVMHAGE
jgi:hypothetical protein